MFAVLLLLSGTAMAQKGKVPADTAKPKTEASKSIEETVKRCRKSAGLFTLYQDTVNGSVFMQIAKDQVNKEFIYFAGTVDGVAAVGSFRGQFRDNKVFSVRKYFNRIEFVTEETSFYFDPKSALSLSADANRSKGVLFSQTIAAESPDHSQFLVKADDVFLTECMQQLKRQAPPAPGAPAFGLGSLSKDKTKYRSLRNYPKNTDVVVEYVYDNPSNNAGGPGEAAEDRYISVVLQHTLIEMPQNNFKPRLEDPRIGFFNTRITDQTSASATPYRDLIHRWNLEKKDKNAALSEPVEPIVWWMEKTTPKEFRPVIQKAGLAWNLAFEKAGFKNAVEIREQPDTATWDAGDIRYNVLRWTSSPSPGFGGYGPSFVNPRTGQILGADIMLEYVFVTNRLKQEKVFINAGRAQYLLPENQNGKSDNFSGINPLACNASECLHHNTLLGMAALNAIGAGQAEKDEYLENSLYYLVLHEMGHTMGLMHNMKASIYRSPAELQNKALTEAGGLTGSVMDYPAVNLASDKSRQGQYWTTRPGPYDAWAIEYGYTPALDDETAEANRLHTLLRRSTEPGLAFGNDADDMRSPGKGIDPHVNVGDLSSDPIGYSSERIKLMNTLLSELKAKYRPATPQSYHELRNQYLIVSGAIEEAAGVVSRYIGGVYVDRSFTDQSPDGGVKPFTPVSFQDQKRAITVLAAQVFSPPALLAPADLYNYLQVQRRGFDSFAQTEDPKITDRALAIQESVLNHLLNPVTLKRITDSELYGNQYKLSDLFNDLSGAIFRDDINTPVNPVRQNLQTEYLLRLIDMADLNPNPAVRSKVHYAARAMALYQLRTIHKFLAKTVAADISTKAHRDYILYKVSHTLNNHTVVKEVVETGGAYGPMAKRRSGGKAPGRRKKRRR